MMMRSWPGVVQIGLIIFLLILSFLYACNLFLLWQTEFRIFYGTKNYLLPLSFRLSFIKLHRFSTFVSFSVIVVNLSDGSWVESRVDITSCQHREFPVGLCFE